MQYMNTLKTALNNVFWSIVYMVKGHNAVVCESQFLLYNRKHIISMGADDKKTCVVWEE